MEGKNARPFLDKLYKKLPLCKNQIFIVNCQNELTPCEAVDLGACNLSKARNSHLAWADFKIKVKQIAHSTLWQYGLWSFQTGYIKLERFLPKNRHTHRKCLNFENWDQWHKMSGKNTYIYFFYFWFKNKLIFASYWGSPIVQFSKFKNFLWVCRFLGKNLSK